MEKEKGDRNADSDSVIIEHPANERQSSESETETAKGQEQTETAWLSEHYHDGGSGCMSGTNNSVSERKSNSSRRRSTSSMGTATIIGSNRLVKREKP